MKTRCKVVIRVDSALWIGSGHVMRCLALAMELRERNFIVSFIVRSYDGNINSIIDLHGFNRINLPNFLPKDTKDTSSKCLPMSWEKDAEQTTKVLKDIGDVKWLVVDHYGIDFRWEEMQREHTMHILIIDDLADRIHDCDLLLDQNMVFNQKIRYDKKIPSNCRLLLGPRFALLKKNYLYWHRVARITIPESKKARILVFFGGTDLTNETEKFLKGWCASKRSDLIANVIIGATHPFIQSIRRQFGNCSGIHLLGYVENMAELMCLASYGFGAIGTTVWERFCVGLNATNVITSENQRDIASYITKSGLAECIGDYNSTSFEHYREALVSLDISSSALLERRNRILSCVDGRGAKRLVNVLRNF